MANINGSDIDVFVNGKQLSNVDCATLLGVEIDSKLSFNEHIEKVCKKLASRIAILRKIRACLPLKQRLQFYNSIIRPVMSYANVVWANCDKESVYRVLRLQKRAARVISYADRMTPSVALFNKLGWIPFYEQLKIKALLLLLLSTQISKTMHPKLETCDKSQAAGIKHDNKQNAVQNHSSRNTRCCKCISVALTIGHFVISVIFLKMGKHSNFRIWIGGPLKVRRHPLPPTGLACVMQDLKLLSFNVQWFPDLGASFSSF